MLLEDTISLKGRNIGTEPLAVFDFNKQLHDLHKALNDLILEHKRKNVIINYITIKTVSQVAIVPRPKPLGLTDDFWIAVATGNIDYDQL